MATDVRALPANMANDAEFRTWGSGIAAQILAMGLVQTADTGQINWTTVTRPTAGNMAGYEIWRFADSLQSTVPVYLRIEYGRDGNQGPKISWQFTIGGSNGAGTLTGKVSSLRNGEANSTKGLGVTLNSYCSGSTGRLVLATNIDTASQSFGFFISVDRTRDASGAATADGVVGFNSCLFDSVQTTVISPNWDTVGEQSGSGSPFPNPGQIGVSSAGGEVALGSHPVIIFGRAFGAFDMVTYVNGNLTAAATFTATFLGATRTFMALANSIGTAQCSNITTPTPAFAILWE